MAFEITRSSPDRLVPLSSLFGRAFVVEPMVLWSLGDYGDVAQRFTGMFEYFLEGLLPLGMVWEVGAGQGAAVWVPPDGAEAWQQAQIRDTRVGELTLDRGRRYAAFFEWVDSKIPDEPLWHLDSVAVEPQARRRGLGAALIEHGLTMARSGGHAAILETGNAANVPYYERFGFRVVREEEAPEQGPRVWFMRRDP